ncbi:MULTISPECIES: hypothetical protein [unclassified Microcoleus]
MDTEAVLGLNDKHGQRYAVELAILGIQGQDGRRFSVQLGS